MIFMFQYFVFTFSIPLFIDNTQFNDFDHLP
jgi:hypothetical protein